MAAHPASRPSSLRIPSLDGVRFLSALLVVICHGIGTPGFPIGMANAYPTAHLAHFAVQTFFVLSGFLITHLLLEEQRADGVISLRRFYLRRGFRILPVAYVYLAVMLLLALAGLVEMTARGVLAALLFQVNHYPWRPPILSHFWTLGVEEQFYLLWPVVLVFLGRRRAVSALFSVMLIAPVVRLSLWRFAPEDWRSTYWFLAQADALAAGCLLACYREKLWSFEPYRRLVASPWCGLAWAGAAFLATFSHRPRLYQFVLVSVIVCLIAVFLDHVMRAPPRWLNTPWIAWAGTWSYSLYVWQQIFMNRSTGWVVTWFPLNVVLSFAAAYLSFRLVEQPMHALGRRLTEQCTDSPQRVSGEDQRIQLLVVPKPGEVEA